MRIMRRTICHRIKIRTGADESKKTRRLYQRCVEQQKENKIAGDNSA